MIETSFKYDRLGFETRYGNPKSFVKVGGRGVLIFLSILEERGVVYNQSDRLHSYNFERNNSRSTARTPLP